MLERYIWKYTTPSRTLRHNKPKSNVGGCENQCSTVLFARLAMCVVRVWEECVGRVCAYAHKLKVKFSNVSSNFPTLREYRGDTGFIYLFILSVYQHLRRWGDDFSFFIDQGDYSFRSNNSFVKKISFVFRFGFQILIKHRVLYSKHEIKFL